MSKLIFNPKKDMKELEKYDYEYLEDWLNRPTKLDGSEGEYIYSKHVAPYTNIEIEVKSGLIFELKEDIYVSVEEKYIDDLRKANLIIDEEELNENIETW